MNRRGVLLIASSVVLALSVASGTAGFDATTAERPLQIGVADDERAYLGVDARDPSLAAGPHEGVALVGLDNRFRSPLVDVDVTVDGDSTTPPVLRGYDAPDSLDPGERATITASVNCDAGSGNPASETWTVSISASGPDVAVDVTRSVTVTCERITATATPAPTSNASASATSDETVVATAAGTRIADSTTARRTAGGDTP